jgi:hypothetical protein
MPMFAETPTSIKDYDNDIDVRKIDCCNGPLWANLSAFAVLYDASYHTSRQDSPR